MINSIVIGLGISFLGLTVFLTARNWNDDIQQRALSGILIGTLATFSLVYFGLKDQHEETTFNVGVVVNNATRLPFTTRPHTLIPSMEERGGVIGVSHLFARQSLFGFLAATEMTLNGKLEKLFDPPTSDEDAQKFYVALLQDCIVGTIRESQQRQVNAFGIWAGHGGDEEGVYEPFVLTKSGQVHSKDFIVTNADPWVTKLLSLPSQQFLGGDAPLVLPPETTVEFRNVNSKGLVVLDKPGYFRIEFQIDFAGSMLNTLPELMAPNIESTTHVYVVRGSATFDRYRSLSDDVQEYLRWTRHILDRVRLRLSDAAAARKS